MKLLVLKASVFLVVLQMFKTALKTMASADISFVKVFQVILSFPKIIFKIALK